MFRGGDNCCPNERETISRRIRQSNARVRICQPNSNDGPEFLTRVRASRVLHRPWVVAPSTEVQFRNYLERVSKPENAGFVVRLRKEQNIVGVINISNSILGMFRSGYLGFYAFSGYERRGLMREADLLAKFKEAIQKCLRIVEPLTQKCKAPFSRGRDHGSYVSVSSPLRVPSELKTNTSMS